MPQPNAWIAEKNEEMQNSTSTEYEELIALRDARRKDTWTPPTKSWWTLEKWIESWRTTMKNSGDKIQWDRIEGWKNKIKACGDLDGGSDEMAEGTWTPEKKRWNTWN